MKVKNLRPYTIVVGGMPIEAGQTKTVPDNSDVEFLVKNGLAEVSNIKIQETKETTIKE